jgi:hypothetical protein
MNGHEETASLRDPAFGDRLAEDVRQAVFNLLNNSSKSVVERGKILMGLAEALQAEGRRLATGDWDAKLADQIERVDAALEKFSAETVAFVGLLNVIEAKVDLNVTSHQHPKAWIEQLDAFRLGASKMKKALAERCPGVVDRVSALTHQAD